jgi:uncharacterized protein (TIGR02466 family)
MTKRKSNKQLAGAFDVRRHQVMAFGTPVIAYTWPESDGINHALEQLILAREQRSEGMSRSNVGGWHSSADFFGWQEDCVKALAKRIQEMTGSITSWVTISNQVTGRTFDYRLDGWANVSRNGCYNSVHNHPHSLWSGVYYVSMGQPDDDRPENGRLELLDPRTGANMVYMQSTRLDERYLIEPIPGLMVVFPGWLKHYVHPFFGDGDRISVAFNLIATERPSADDAA